MAGARYRRFLRLCQEWPLDPSKEGQDLGSYIRQMVARGFKHGEASDVDVAKCDKAYESLQRINSSAAGRQYPRAASCASVSVSGCSLEELRYINSPEGQKVLNDE